MPSNGPGNGRNAHAQDAFRDVLWDVMKLLVVAQKAGQVGVQVGCTKASKLSPKGANDLDFCVSIRPSSPLSPLENDTPIQKTNGPFSRAMEDIYHISDELGTSLFGRQTEPFFTLPVQLLGANVLFYGRNAHGFHAFIVQCRFI